MIIENRGLKTNTFSIPPFILNKGEIVVVYISNGEYYNNIELCLKDLFTGKTTNKSINIHHPLSDIHHFKESKFRRFLHPITVGEYLKKNANLNSPYANKIYENNWITKNTNVNSLAGTPRKLLSIYATLTRAKNIVVDLAGLDPMGAERICEVVKEAVRKEGSSIILDRFEDMKNNCTKYVEVSCE